jgi:hypothetical protein
MPKNYDSNTIAKEIKKLNPDIKIPKDLIVEDNEKEDKDSVFINVSLSILSGFVFGFIWSIFMMKEIYKTTKEKCGIFNLILSFIIPFYSIYYLLKMNKILNKKAKTSKIKMKNKTWIYVLTSLLLPILPLNIISLAVLQHDVNKF